MVVEEHLEAAQEVVSVVVVAVVASAVVEVSQQHFGGGCVYSLKTQKCQRNAYTNPFSSRHRRTKRRC